MLSPPTTKPTHTAQGMVTSDLKISRPTNIEYESHKRVHGGKLMASVEEKCFLTQPLNVSFNGYI